MRNKKVVELLGVKIAVKVLDQCTASILAGCQRFWNTSGIPRYDLLKRKDEEQAV